MKTLLILILILALAAVAVFTRPSQANFESYFRQQQQAGTTDLSLKGIVKDYEVDSYLKSVTFHNRLLFVTVEKDGQRQYTGVFGHWFKAKPAQATSPQPG